MPDRSSSLAGLRILIVEDGGLVAMQLRSQLEDLDCRVVATAARLADAIGLAESVEIDGALLDLNLAGEESYPVAAILERREIPFILISGYDSTHLHPAYADTAHLRKPFDGESLAAMLASTILPSRR